MMKKANSNSHLQQTHREILNQSIVSRYQTPVFIGMLICGTLSLVFSLISMLSQNPLDNLRDLLYQISFIGQEISIPLNTTNGTVQSIQIVLWLCGAATMAGFWIVFWCAKSNADANAFSVGFTTIEIVKFNQLVVSLFLLPWLAIRGYNLLDTIKNHVAESTANGISSQISLLQILLVVAALGTVVYLFDALLTLMILKDSACTVCANSQMSYYSPIYYFVLVAFVLYTQFKFVFSIPVLFACMAIFLYAIFIIQYRNEMKRYE